MIARRVAPEVRYRVPPLPNDGRTYLYYYGNECEAMTGGWNVYNADPYYYSDAEYSKSNDYMSCGETTNRYNSCQIRQNRTVDLSVYSKLYVDYSFTQVLSDNTYPTCLNIYVVSTDDWTARKSTHVSETIVSSLATPSSDANTSSFTKFFTTSVIADTGRLVEYLDLTSGDKELLKNAWLIFYPFSGSWSNHKGIAHFYRFWLE